MSYAQALKRHGSRAAAARALKVPVSTFKDKLAKELASKPQRANVLKMPESRAADWYARGNRVLFDDGRRLELERLPEIVLAFSCTQAPFQHVDAAAFLSLVKATYTPQLSICLGDELDLKFLKKHFMSPDDLGPVQELEAGRQFVATLAKIFPQLLLLTSNHVSERIGYARHNGNFPSTMLRDWRDVIQAPDAWLWRDYILARNWLFEHGHSVSKGNRGSIAEDTTKRFGRPVSIMRGHFHSEFGEHLKPIWLSADRQLRMAYTGCLMDRDEVTYTRAPVMLGCIVLIRGVPHPVPLVTDRHNRWIGRLPEW